METAGVLFIEGTKESKLARERTRSNVRRVQEPQNSGALRRGLIKSPAKKRTGEVRTTKKKRKYPLLSENWGTEAGGEKSMDC